MIESTMETISTSSDVVKSGDDDDDDKVSWDDEYVGKMWERYTTAAPPVDHSGDTLVKSGSLLLTQPPTLCL